MNNVFIVDAVRTPLGSFGGSLSEINAVELGAHVVRALIARTGIDPSQIDELIFGCVLQGGQGQNVARQVLIRAGIPKEVPAMTLNNVCASGLRSVSLASSIIKAGDAQMIVCGGTENMSAANDFMIHDGLWDIFNDYHMGITAENIAERYSVSRREQDELSARSQQLAEKAIFEGRFADEIAPIEIPQPNGDPVIFDQDEYPYFGTTVDSLSALDPAFKDNGTVTAGNASGINDGAAAILVVSENRARELNLKPMAKVVAYGTAGVDPAVMGTGPIPATQKALSNAGLTIDDIDLAEINEAFASQATVVMRELGISLDRVNVNGGSIALGHPIGSSGARILTTLLHEMKKRDDVKRGLATLCAGGGMGAAIIVEKVV
jgi:acetyl-CoA C-acetyltransferase